MPRSCYTFPGGHDENYASPSLLNPSAHAERNAGDSRLTTATSAQCYVRTAHASPHHLKCGGNLYGRRASDQFTVAVRVTSEAEYLFAMAMPAPEYPGRYVVFEGGDRSGRGTSAILYLTLRGKGSTLADFPDGVPIHFVVAARFKNGVTASQWYDFHVVVP